MSVSLGQLHYFFENSRKRVAFDRESVHDDPIALVDLLLIGVFRVHLKELHLLGLNAQIVKTYVDVLELKEPLLLKAGRHLKISCSVVNSNGLSHVLAQLQRHSAH